ncbi:MAG TPA: helix-turn-helix domain-containing protein [Solirubrobacteraceae bacterium]|nr:helix-turn-helix domain-containing protein [Solirubrobacteraceae bacterium]
MSTGTRLPAAARREQILDATKGIAVRRGFHAVSIDAVARAAGISRPIVYDHFRDLNGLLEALVEREVARSRAQLEAVVPTKIAPGDARGALLDAQRRYLEAAQADPDTWRLVLMPPEGAPESLRAHIAAGRAEAIAALATAVGPVLGERSVPDPELAARMLSTLADEGVRLVLTDPERYPVERVLAASRWMLERLI